MRTLLLALALLFTTGCISQPGLGEFPQRYRQDYSYATSWVELREDHPHQGFNQVWVNPMGRPVAHKGGVYEPGTVWLLRNHHLVGQAEELWQPGTVKGYYLTRRVDPEDPAYDEATGGIVYEFYPAPEGDPGDAGSQLQVVEAPARSCHDCHQQAAGLDYQFSRFDR